MAEKDDWVVTVGKEMARKDDWVVTIKAELQRMDTIRTVEEQHWDKRSIYRVPASVVTDLNMKAYKPQFVSFGPYHHGEDHLKPKEEMAEKDDWVVTVGKEMARKDDWVVTIKAELQRMDTIRTVEEQHWDKRSIYRVPASVVTDLNMKAYKPQFVSFGPYHHGEDHLKPMEEHKHRALLHFLKRSYRPLESYLSALAEVAQSLKHSYESLNLGWERDTDRFLQMMILDGCFMLEQDEEFVNKLILQFFRCNIRFSSDIRMDKCLHLLDAHRKILLWEDSCNLTGRQRKSWCRWNILSCLMGHEAGAGDAIIRSAMEIHEAGISFKKSKSQSLQHISFEGGKLRLPPIVVDDTTESMFLNLIAFERFHVGVGNEVTSYLFFMDSIIDSAKDVSLLHDKGIIQNALGSDKAVAELFNSIAKDATLDPASSLDRVHKTVDKYCKQRCNKWRANAKHTYFRNPWAIISVIAAFVLFALTILQAIYTMLSYYDPLS